MKKIVIALMAVVFAGSMLMAAEAVKATETKAVVPAVKAAPATAKVNFLKRLKKAKKIKAVVPVTTPATTVPAAK